MSKKIIWFFNGISFFILYVLLMWSLNYFRGNYISCENWLILFFLDLLLVVRGHIICLKRYKIMRELFINELDLISGAADNNAPGFIESGVVGAAIGALIGIGIADRLDGGNY
ncbi:hypothetical protein ACG95N_08780 [Acinetobacter guillouiae]|uniref:hypothetical protein n=1 Tax=Acinetobacter guillouiae TaxID=106649 RepID=UPI003AF590CC